MQQVKDENNILPFKWNMTLTSEAWKKGLFYAKYPANSEYKWCDSDVPQFAIFQDDNITYKFNEYGFRSESFSSRGQYNVLVSGCSLTVGVGVPYSQSWAPVLGEKIRNATNKSISVWNLAQSGCSPDYVVRSIYQTIDTLAPDLIVVNWPATSRFEFPVNKYSNKLQDFMIPDDSGTGILNYPLQLINDFYFSHEFRKNVIFLEMLCKQHNIPLIHGGAEGTDLNVDFREGARDGQHPDVVWHEQWATAVFDRWLTMQL